MNVASFSLTDDDGYSSDQSIVSVYFTVSSGERRSVERHEKIDGANVGISTVDRYREVWIDVSVAVAYVDNMI